MPKYSEVVKQQRVQQCSLNTSDDSVQKIAREAERIGKILGLTVVQNEKAVANRTTSLKKNKRPLHRERPPKRVTGAQH